MLSSRKSQVWLNPLSPPLKWQKKWEVRTTHALSTQSLWTCNSKGFQPLEVLKMSVVRSQIILKDLCLVPTTTETDICAWGWKCEIALHISLSLTMSCKKSATPVDLGATKNYAGKKPVTYLLLLERHWGAWESIFFQPTSWMTSVKTLLYYTLKGEITCGNSRSETATIHSSQFSFKKAKTHFMSSWVRKSLLLQVCICRVWAWTHLVARLPFQRHRS